MPSGRYKGAVCRYGFAGEIVARSECRMVRMDGGVGWGAVQCTRLILSENSKLRFPGMNSREGVQPAETPLLSWNVEMNLTNEPDEMNRDLWESDQAKRMANKSSLL